MVRFGYALSCEEHGPSELVRFAAMAEQAGFTDAWISDHYHPWISEQGNSPFVWSVLGGIAEACPRLRVGTAVTCPTIRIHPAIVAQAAATAAVMLAGRFFVGVGTGEALNEHVLGDPWPEIDVRLEMLEEAVEVMRKLWTGEAVSHRGRYYRVEDARLFTVPPDPPPVYVSAFGPKAVEVAARIGDGYVGTSPSTDLVGRYSSQAGDMPRLGGPKVCWAEDEAEAARLVHRLWPNTGLPGQLAQDLRKVAHFEQAVELVTEQHVPGDTIPVGPDPGRHVQSLQQYIDAGYTEIYVHQIGPDQQGFLRFYRDEVLPQLQ